ncbi:hypothetical protein CRENPOLYSF1_170044 [Crenothrix polyspora]|uniref:Transposase n=1 Tax=Crenothrix polyspora TaxID=360316 RepID=A0A1R4H405_9GAMM|nr:hypothetical protein CRENPOLYSF1_170044 [Crenothrix polyspora]
MPKIKIFNTSEKNAFESPPVFNSLERRRFFTLPQMLNEAMGNLKSPTNKVCFTVTAGYFKARHRFFARQFHQTDIAYVARQIGVQIDDVDTSVYDKATYLRHQHIILNYFGFTLFDTVARAFAKHEILIMLRVQFRPKLILLDIIQVLTRKEISLPSYNVLAALIVEAINEHQHGLNRIIEASLNKAQQDTLDALLEKATGSGSDEKWRYQITLLKKASQSTRPSKIEANLADLQNLMALYVEFKPVVNQLGLSYECLRYYAYSVIKAQVHQVSRRAKQDRYLHLIAFIVYQTLKLQDMLIDVLLLAVQSAINATYNEHKEICYQEMESRNQSVTQLVDGLQNDFKSTLATIKAIIADAGLTADQKVVAIGETINHPVSKKSGIEQRINKFKDELTTLQQQGIGYYDLLEKRSLKLQGRVADIVRQTIFDSNCGKPLLLEAIVHYQKKSGNIDKQAPIAFLTPEQRSLIVAQDGKFRVSLYKALLYLAVADAIKSGVLNLIHSEKYRSLDDYMIPKPDWDANRDEYLYRAELTRYADCQATLKALSQAVDLRYEETNNRFTAGGNPHLTFRGDGTFHVSTPKLEEMDSLSLGSIFPERKYIPLLEALATVDNATGFLEEFEHWQMKHRQTKPAKKVFFAGIMAYGCDIGHRKLAQISKQINENELDNTLNWYFSLANVQSANDRILQFMDKMEIPDIYRNQAGQLHTSSDGQKVGVSVDSLNANYSFKYLGKDKGASVISFIDMRQMMWHSMVISSAEREAPYVIDGLMHNDVGYARLFRSDICLHFFPELHVCTPHQRTRSPEAVCVQEWKNKNNGARHSGLST